MSMHVITACQQEQSIDNYIERDIIVGLQVHKPLIKKMNAQLRVEYCKNHRHRNVGGKISDEASYSRQVGIKRTREQYSVGLNPRYTVGGWERWGMVAGIQASLEGEGHCKSVQKCLSAITLTL